MLAELHGLKIVVEYQLVPCPGGCDVDELLVVPHPVIGFRAGATRESQRKEDFVLFIPHRIQSTPSDCGME